LGIAVVNWLLSRMEAPSNWWKLSVMDDLGVNKEGRMISTHL
jgi:hypothetical protein